MRANYITAAEAAALAETGAVIESIPVLTSTIQVFPMFIMRTMPGFFAGLLLGTLFLTVIGGGAGLSLGMATIMVRDIYKHISNHFDSPAGELAGTRISIAVILLTAACITLFIPNSTINDIGFLSMGLRGTVVFVPLLCALWLRGRIDRGCILLSIVVSPLAVIAAKLAALPFDPLFAGLAVSFLLAAIGYAKKKPSAS